nr:MAG TPA: Regulatory phage protein cox [Caudoviricetes sp.]
MTLLKIKSKTTIRTRVKEGRLRRSQQGRREIYFLGKDLIDFISNGRN